MLHLADLPKAQVTLPCRVNSCTAELCGAAWETTTIKRKGMSGNGMFQLMSGIVGSTGDATGRMEKFTELVRSLVDQHDVQQLKDLVDCMLAEESSFALFARPVLQQVAEKMEKLKNSELKELARHTLDRLRGRVVSFEEEDFVMRELLSEVFQAEGDWAEAAKCLAAINLESGTRCRTPLQKAEKYVKIAELYLEDDDPVAADTFCSRAAMVMHEVNDTPLLLRYRVCHVLVATAVPAALAETVVVVAPAAAAAIVALAAAAAIVAAAAIAAAVVGVDAVVVDVEEGPVEQTIRKGKGKGKRAPNAEHCLPPIHPEVEALCKKFAIEEKIMRRLDDVMRTREDSFETDLKALYEVCESAKKPSGSLMVKIGELERGCFTGADKLDQCMLTFRSKYKLDDRALARFVEVCHPRSQKLDDIRQMEKYLKNAPNPSQVVIPLLMRIEKEGRLPSPERTKDKDKERIGLESVNRAPDHAQADLLQLLKCAVTCAILAPAGPQRSRILASLCKDERIRAVEHFEILQKMFMERLIRGSEVHKFEDGLLPHQKATGPDGSTVLERAVLQHNVLAASRVYKNMRLPQLGHLLEVSPEHAEKIAAKMIAEKRLAGFIDQKSGVIHFEGTEIVDHRLAKFCHFVLSVICIYTLYNIFAYI
ncbi:unnamed protein product [Cladocopium goreaui]|uniref:COP9 signalosome complex subunit 4 n=1 Tax=Cladocopium goreaui TaxID=2562237 RepID=A0A9P1BXR2_9DINO|nr:unnamed protein product [Cladocopium goreaui]